MVEVLYAYMNGRFVGELRREIGGDLSFVYDDAWLEATDVHRSLSLSLRLQTKEHRGGRSETSLLTCFRITRMLWRQSQTVWNFARRMSSTF